MADQIQPSGEKEVAAGSESNLLEPDLEQIRNALAFIKDVRFDLENQSPDTKSMRPADTHNEVEGLNDKSSDRIGQRIPKKLGRFEIVNRIGQGGFAIVYLARDPNLERLVALKVLTRSHTISIDSRARFEREARAAASLNHPNIVSVFETGMVDDQPFIAAAFCPGVSLRRWFENQQVIAPRFAAKIVSLLADATGHAHQRGIIHRDLKPANILIECTGDRAVETQSSFDTELLHITDFGLARYTTPTDQLETSEGAIVGTPAYMSPEQARGEMGTTLATDIYSLGVILYQLLTKQLPILGATHIETLLAIGNKTPTALRKLDKSIPRDLEAICLKCLSKSPTDRYLSSHDLYADLNRWLKGQPVVARRISRTVRLSKWCARNPILTAAFVGVSVALCVAVAQWRGASQQSQRADRHRAMTQRVIDEMVSNVASDPNLPPEMRKSITQRAVDLQIQLMEEEPDNNDIRRQTLRSLDRQIVLLVELYEHESALIAADQALQVVEPVCQEPDFAAMKMNMIRHRVNLLRYLGELDVAENELAHARENNPQAQFDQAKNFFEAGMLRLGRQNYEEARTEFKNALTIYEQVGNHAHLGLEVARSHFFCGFAELKLGNLELAKMQMVNAELIYQSKYRSMKSNETILEDFGKTHLYLGHVARKQLSEFAGPASGACPLLIASRMHFNEASRLFKELLDLNPLRLGTYGLLAMTYEYHVAMEVEQGDVELTGQVIKEFSKLFQIVPVNVPERLIIGRILAESKLKLVKGLIEAGDVDQATGQLKACIEFIDDLLSEYPHVERLDALKHECQELLKKTG